MSTTDTINPLLDLHRQAEAEFQAYGPAEIVSTFGEPQAEYGAVRKACGMIDQPQRAIVEISGKDRLTFLNNLLTNQTWDKQSKSGPAGGSGVYAYLLHAKNGRIMLDTNVLERGDRTLLDIDRRLVQLFIAALSKYHFAEAIEIHDRSPEFRQIALHGPGSVSLLEQACDGSVILPTAQLHSTSARILGHEIVAWRDDICAVPGFHLIVETAQVRAIWMQLLTRFSAGAEIGKRPLRPIGWAAFNATRIEAGRAMFGIDFDETFLPAETGRLQMARAVSFTKGCYPGQEIVARMHARSQVARQIVGFKMDDEALPIAGAQIFDEQSNVIGAVTSSTISPILSGASIGLALVKRSHTDAGKSVQIPAEGSIRTARVVELPFIKGAST
ncbi:MAG: aminomethyl transferase family protein [Burkholderiales bacterium]|nr:aminomethyl transferase family protein [Phycisphaerae bacterium]